MNGVLLMSENDRFRTVREMFDPVAEELASAGFEDAEVIGRGGFGVVYCCTQTELDRTVAVKVLTAELDTENRARFLREQRAMGRLTGHPNIVTVLQAGVTTSGRPYLVMAYHPMGSLDERIRAHGPLPVETVLWIAVKIAGALETAHRLGILHRDVKPGNILLTDYGEPALTDFGIARVIGGFETETGTVTGSPAFTAPEVLEGEVPTTAADVYGLGATLFCALTGHAAFERRSGENVVTQFLRITTQAVPNLSEHGIAEDVSVLIAAAMSRDPHQRPSVAGVGEAAQQSQRRHGFAAHDMALHSEPTRERHGRGSNVSKWTPTSTTHAHGAGTLPQELTTFVDRRTELAEVKNLLTSARLVTLTGIGGVGKTRLALRAAAGARREFTDGVWLVELADVSDPSVLVEVVAATLGLRDDTARPLSAVLHQFLGDRKSLMVLDNCEQLITAVAELVDSWLRNCPKLKVLVTSREPLDIDGEAVLPVPPLPVPDYERAPSARSLYRYDAVTLFADRAMTVVPGLELSDDDKKIAARICTRLEGLPLAIELAAARMRTMSPEQILARLDDRYALLTRASRSAPTRQQTLRWCVDWSYELCTPVEQRLWDLVSVFVGSFELDAVEEICGTEVAPEVPADVLSWLVDKSIVSRVASGGAVQFRMLETVRDYGREKLQDRGEYTETLRRHRDWYHQLALAADAEWISDRQPYWISRLNRELPNLRAALEFCSTENTDQGVAIGLRTATALFVFWSFQGLFGEGRRWIGRFLDNSARQPVTDRVEALVSGAVMATLQGDFSAASTLIEEGRSLVRQDPSPTNQARIDFADGSLALYGGDLARASALLRRSVEVLASSRPGYDYLAAATALGWALNLAGDTRGARDTYQHLLSIAEARGGFLFRSSALWGLGTACWQEGQFYQARELLEQALLVNRRVDSPLIAALVLETLSWIASATGEAERAAVLTGASEELQRAMGNPASIFPAPDHHDEGVRSMRSALGRRRFAAAVDRGRSMSVDEAVSYALGEQPPDIRSRSDPRVALTNRERQVADLVAQGLTDKQIAARLVISLRTAQGHVGHILTKLGFTSRAQIAMWVADTAEPHNR